MEVARSAVNVLLVLQKICCPPCHLYVQRHRHQVAIKVEHAFYNKTKMSKSRKWWDLNKLLTWFFKVFSGLRIGFLFKKRKQWNKVEQLCFFTVLQSVCSSFNDILFITALHAWTCIVTKESLKYIQFQYSGCLSFWTIPSLMETVIYWCFGFLYHFTFCQFHCYWITMCLD